MTNTNEVTCTLHPLLVNVEYIMRQLPLPMAAPLATTAPLPENKHVSGGDLDSSDMNEDANTNDESKDLNGHISAQSRSTSATDSIKILLAVMLKKNAFMWVRKLFYEAQVLNPSQ